MPFVSGLRDGEPVRDGNLRIWTRFTGVNIAMRVIEGRGTIRNDAVDEVLYDIDRDAGIYLPAGEHKLINGTFVGVSGPASAGSPAGLPALHSVAVSDQTMQRTGDRFYTELIQSEITQFVGAIPPGRAPDHFHLYEEALCVLEGHGRIWNDAESAPIEPGSCVYLPRQQIHCVENLGHDYLRLLGVFYPAGSPAVRYDVHERAEDGPEQGELDRRD